MWLSMLECFDVTELMDGDDKVESLWVKIRGRADKADILVGVCYRLLNEDEETGVLQASGRSCVIASPCPHGGHQLPRPMLGIQHNAEEAV